MAAHFVVILSADADTGDRATIPPRIFLKQRTVFCCAWFSAFLAMGLYIHVYYLPIYFQAIKGTTAEGSGIRLIAYLVSNTIVSIIVGGTITSVGYYVPFMWLAAAIFTIGSGLLTTFKVESSRATWIGYQVLTGAGSGMGVQIPFTAVQVVLSAKDMPSGSEFMTLAIQPAGCCCLTTACTACRCNYHFLQHPWRRNFHFCSPEHFPQQAYPKTSPVRS